MFVVILSSIGTHIIGVNKCSGSISMGIHVGSDSSSIGINNCSGTSIIGMWISRDICSECL